MDTILRFLTPARFPPAMESVTTSSVSSDVAIRSSAGPDKIPCVAKAKTRWGERRTGCRSPLNKNR